MLCTVQYIQTTVQILYILIRHGALKRKESWNHTNSGTNKSRIPIPQPTERPNQRRRRQRPRLFFLRPVIACALPQRLLQRPRHPLRSQPRPLEVRSAGAQPQRRQPARDEERDVLLPHEVVRDARQALFDLDGILAVHSPQERDLADVGFHARGEVDVVDARGQVRDRGVGGDSPGLGRGVEFVRGDDGARVDGEALAGDVLLQDLVEARRDAAAVAGGLDHLEPLVVVVGRPEDGLFVVSELAHPGQADVEGFDYVRSQYSFSGSFRF